VLADTYFFVAGSNDFNESNQEKKRCTASRMGYDNVRSFPVHVLSDDGLCGFRFKDFLFEVLKHTR
jgi:hypothetical protein